MGAELFTAISRGRTAQEAFNAAVEEAQHEYGHRGYTGTIAEKHGFKMVEPAAGERVEFCIDRCLDDEKHFCQDKWGPAACVLKQKGEDGINVYVFFGWASS